MRPQGHIKAPPKPVDSQAIATPEPWGQTEATLKPYGSQPVGTLKPTRGYPQATLRLPRGYPEARQGGTALRPGPPGRVQRFIYSRKPLNEAVKSRTCIFNPAEARSCCERVRVCTENEMLPSALPVTDHACQ
jgi:hypothetical protein